MTRAAPMHPAGRAAALACLLGAGLGGCAPGAAAGPALGEVVAALLLAASLVMASGLAGAYGAGGRAQHRRPGGAAPARGGPSPAPAADAVEAEHARALEAANQELERFAAIVAHDLKAPLRHIAILAGWVEEELGPLVSPAARERLRQIRERAARTTALIDGLHRYAKAGGLGAERGPVALEPLVRGCVELLGPPPGFRFELDLEPRVIEAAEPPLATVLRNLIDNAVRHHDRGAGEIRVGARPAPRGMVEFSVADDGPGIPPRLHVLVFDMFRSFGPDLGSTGEGVGLTLVRRIVAAHGGTVWVRPKGEGERGTDMRFTWPGGGSPVGPDAAAAAAGHGG